ncbi:MAG: glutaredoxin family protein [Anaerolineales bacterium]|nr:glutaredoxin family protein [Anaerolineales bacterium]
MDKEIVMYVRSAYCPSVALARDLLNRYHIPYREINISTDPAMADRVREWTGFLSVPTIILANSGEDLPYTDFLPRPADRSLKGYNRGPMITEPNNKDLEDWLYQHGFLDKPYKR